MKLSGLQRDVLEVVLRSQLEMKKAVLKALMESYTLSKDYDHGSAGNKLILVTKVEITEIERQLSVLFPETEHPGEIAG